MTWEREYRELRSRLPKEFAQVERHDFGVDVLPAQREGRVESLKLARSATTPELFDYQEDLVRAVEQVYLDRSVALLSMPTGAGKTRTAVAAVLALMAEAGCKRVVWLAPSVELVDQAIRTFQVIWRDFGAAPDITLSRRFSRREEGFIWLTTPQTVSAALSRSRSLATWELVIFDEAHQLGARTYRSATEALRTEGITALVGLSATPGRTLPGETEALVELFGGRLLRSDRLGSNPVAALQKRGVLARLNFRKFSQRLVAKDDEPERILIAARAAQELFRRGRHVLVFAASVAGAYLLQDILRGLDVPAQAVDASLNDRERAAAIDAFARRETAVLINQRLLATGYDCPAVTDVFLLAQVGSAILFEQMVGRAARGVKTGGSRVATIWEFDDHLALHGLPSSYYRYRDYEWTAG